MKYTKEIKKGFLIFGTLAVFALIAVVILFIVANVDYKAVNNFIQSFKIKNATDLNPNTTTELNKTELKIMEWQNNHTKLVSEFMECIKHNLHADQINKCSQIEYYVK